MKNEKFLGYTIGIRCKNGETSKLIKIEYTRIEDKIRLRAVSGNNLEPLKSYPSISIDIDEYNDRPFDVTNNLTEMDWACEKLGWSICGR